MKARLALNASMLSLLPLANFAPARAAPLQGAFLHLGFSAASPSFTEGDLLRQFDEFKALGLSLVIIAAVKIRNPAGCGSQTFEWLPFMPDRAPWLLREAQARGLSVMFGTVGGAGCFSSEAPNTQVMAAQTAEAVATLTALLSGMQGFAGWYISDEPSLGFDIPTQNLHFKALADAVRGASGDTRVAVSPMMGNQPVTAAQMASRARAFQDTTGVQTQIWQDSAGGGMDLGWGRTHQSIADFYGQIAAAIGPEHLWADLELFNAPTSGYTGLQYRPAAITRFQAQVDASQAATFRVAWLHQYHMGSVDQNRFPESDRFLREYKARFGLGGAPVAPINYSYVTPPSPVYPDAAGELTNGLVADQKNFQHSAWVGIERDTEINFAFDAARRIDWVSVHLMQKPEPSIYIPQYLSIYCSEDGNNFSLLRTVQRPFDDYGTSGEYVMSTDQPLRTDCRHAKIKLRNSGWTFLSEVTFTSDSADAPAVVPPVQQIPATTTEAPPAQAPTSAGMPPLPQVRLVVSGHQVDSGIGVNNVGPVATYNIGFAVGFSALAPLGPGDQCRLHYTPTTTMQLEHRMQSADMLWHQDNFPPLPAGTQSWFCAVCFGSRDGVWVENNACASVLH